MKKAIVVITVLVLLAAAGITYAMYRKKKKAVEPAPVVPDKPFDPTNPKRTPTAGAAYVVQSGDTMTNIVSRAGFPSAKVHVAYLAMLRDTENKWIGTTFAWGEESLRFYKRFDAVPGKDYSYKGTYHDAPSAALAWPVVRVPALGEV